MIPVSVGPTKLSIHPSSYIHRPYLPNPRKMCALRDCELAWGSNPAPASLR